MYLPCYLQPGYVLIYGQGSTQGISNIQPSSTEFLFGRIHQVWNYGNINAQVGDSVMFKDSDAECRLIFQGWPYTLIQQARLAITEIQIIEP